MKICSSAGESVVAIGVDLETEGDLGLCQCLHQLSAVLEMDVVCGMYVTGYSN